MKFFKIAALALSTIVMSIPLEDEFSSHEHLNNIDNQIKSSPADSTQDLAVEKNHFEEKGQMATHVPASILVSSISNSASTVSSALFSLPSSVSVVSTSSTSFTSLSFTTVSATVPTSMTTTDVYSSTLSTPSSTDIDDNENNYDDTDDQEEPDDAPDVQPDLVTPMIIDDHHVSNHHLGKVQGSQIFKGDATFYATGLGACGYQNTDNQLVVALSKDLYDNFKGCGRKIVATRGSKSVTVSVVDRCEGCSYYSLDFSPAAFRQLGTDDEGRIPITWRWV